MQTVINRKEYCNAMPWLGLRAEASLLWFHAAYYSADDHKYMS